MLAVAPNARSVLTHCIRTASHVRTLASKAPKSKPDVGSTSAGIPKPRLNYRDISDNVVFKSHNAFNRKAALPVGAIQNIARLYQEQKGLSNTLNEKRHARSTVGERIRLAAKDAEKKQTIMDEAKALKAEITQLESRLEGIEEELFKLAIAVPNDTHPSVPIGPESVAEVLSTHGPAPVPPSPTRDHVAIGRALNLLDFQAGATVTGSSWYYLLNEGALLEVALINYAMSIAIKHGFTPVTVPDVVRADIANRCGFQPRDQEADQMYHLASSSVSSTSSSDSPELVLAGTAEIPLAGFFANKVLDGSSLPIKLVGVGRAFRAEAGARGADTRGLYRVHQFTKVELFAITQGFDGGSISATEIKEATAPSEQMMEDIRGVQVEIFEGLGIPFRVLDMPTEELGASAYRKYDMEAWMPGRGSWGEISSTSNCTDYQSRRMHIRYRHPVSSSRSGDASKPTKSTQTTLPFAHTLNGTAAAVPRLIVALLENGARFGSDGEVEGIDLPKVLKPFWVGGEGRGIVRWI
ncbi:seryl-tRNA synthetase [Panus rudis PR-1116 ss-1]|nr:seryl-tRNA synthetase [Panus rudis PR-1116 ss-1]